MIFVISDLRNNSIFSSLESEEFTEKLTDIYLFSFQNRQKIASLLETKQTLTKLDEAQAEGTISNVDKHLIQTFHCS